MEAVEFAQVMAYLGAGCGKPVPADTAEVYYDLLGDLPLRALQYAAKRALLESKFSVLPTPGQLRELAMGSDGEPWAEAWTLAKRYATIMACEYDLIDGERTEVLQSRLLEKMPDPVRRAALAIGWKEIAEPLNPVATRAHFRAAYEGVAENQRRVSILPNHVKNLQLPTPRPALAHEVA